MSQQTINAIKLKSLTNQTICLWTRGLKTAIGQTTRQASWEIRKKRIRKGNNSTDEKSTNTASS